MRAAKLDSIEVLRGFAALLVAGFHLNKAAIAETDYSGAFKFVANGESGVDIFFVISGFIIYYTAARRPGLTVPDFLRARFWRIYPPYWAILCLLIGLRGVEAALNGGDAQVPGIGSLTTSFLLFPYGDFILVIAWTLALEVLFYLVFSLTFLRSGPATFFAAMCVWVLAAEALSWAGIAQASGLSIVFHTAVAEFLFGAVIAVLVLRGSPPFRNVSLCVGVILMLAHLGGVSPLDEVWSGREVSAGVPAALLVYGATGLRWNMPRLLVLLGEASYLLYLMHLIVFSVTAVVLERLLDGSVYATTGRLVILLAVAVCVSTLATLWFERPYRRWYAGFLAARKARLSVPAAGPGG